MIYRIRKYLQPVSIYLLLIFSTGLVCSHTVLAQSYEDGRSAYIQGNYIRAYELLLPLAEEGNAEAQKILGIMYDYGHGVEKDQERALEWYLRAASQGQVSVQYQVGAKYFRGEGTYRNYEEAAIWWERAANGGQVDAQFNLGLMYFRGLSVEPDNTRAAELFRLAAEQGHNYAQYSLAVMYSFGQGVDKDYATAFKWFTLAAEQGLAQAQFNMGVYYENGYGIEQDIGKARMWYERAAAQGLDQAIAKLDALSAAGSITETAPVQAPSVQSSYTADEIRTNNIRREDWVLRQPADYYTLQLVSLVDEQDIINFIREHGIEQEAAYIKVVVNGVTRYNALYGVYDNYDNTLQAVDELPASLSRIEPWARNFRVLHGMLGQ
jgi:hypothetical protein